jgi:hypothetical protein
LPGSTVTGSRAAIESVKSEFESALVRPTLFKRVERADWDDVEKAAAKHGKFIGVSAELARRV